MKSPRVARRLGLPPNRSIVADDRELSDEVVKLFRMPGMRRGPTSSRIRWIPGSGATFSAAGIDLDARLTGQTQFVRVLLRAMREYPPTRQGGGSSAIWMLEEADLADIAEDPQHAL